MIEKIKEYIDKCPYLEEFVEGNIDYLVDKVKSYSISDSAGYNPVISKDVVGNKYMQLLFNFDAKLHWNEEIKNNIDNSKFFENFRNWLEENDEQGIYPDIDGIEPETISATTNGFIFATNADQAIYRISCKFTYFKGGK